MGIQIPKAQLSSSPRTSKQYDNGDLIMKVLGTNPYAQAIDQITPVLAQALQRRQQLRAQGQTNDLVTKTLGMDVPEGTDISRIPTSDLIQVAAAKTNAEKANQFDFAGLSADGKNMIVLDKRSGQTALRPLPDGFAPKAGASGGMSEYQKATLKFKQEAQDFSRQKLTLPTAQIRSMGETAVTVLPHIDNLSNTIREAAQKGYIGPVAGRVYNEFLAGKVGTTGNAEADTLLGKLRAEDSLVKTAMLRTHFGARGGQEMYNHFASLLDTGKQSEEQMHAALDVFKDFASGYAQAGGVNQANFNAGGAAAFDPNMLRMPPKKASLTPIQSGESPQQRKARLLQELSGAR